ncbi:MAG: phosphoribosylformylglycinamidine cyclo-ligase [Waddliaceae bacterium]|nr:phosphoribosylformylglycinamidine cyclo-ligase [Waddliaceae bacterium]
MTYEDAGVNISSGNELVERIKKRCPSIGGFSGLFPFGDQFLVGSTDGVGTKLKIAFALNKHDTVGIDLVAMCVNDLLTVGARPLFFLDYFASSKLNVDQAEEVISGIIEGCRQASCQLLGGETAELPGFYHDEEYDLCGFVTGVVSKEERIDGSSIVAGDLLLGLPSSGLHSNGYSLARKVVEFSGTNLHSTPDLLSRSLGEELLEPTKIYVDEIARIRSLVPVKGIAHITGGGLIENTPRMLPKGLGIKFHRGSWSIPPIFRWLQCKGDIVEEEMFRTFNMGIGMVLALDADSAKKLAREEGLKILGEVTKEAGVTWL